MAISVKVGSFAKATGTGVPVSQAVTGLGFTPKCLFLFSVAQTASGAWAAGVGECLGVTAGASQSGAVGVSIPDASAFTAGRPAAKALTFCDITGAAVAECDLTSFDADGFTLSWTTNNTAAYVLHYLALGGSDLTNAAVVSWNTPASATSQSVTGVGFKPDCLLHIAGPSSAGSAPTPSLGVMTAAGDQWAADWAATGATKAVCSLDPGAGVAQYNAGTSALLTQVGLTSMDSDGFTVYGYTSVAKPVYTLCLKGASFRAGVFGKTTAGATASQAVPATSFTPSAVLLASNSQLSSALSTGARLSVGASDGTNHHGVVLTYKDSASPPVSKALDSVTKCVTKANNDTSTTEATASVSSLNTNGFTLSWTTNDATHALIGYLAVGPTSAGTGGGGTRAYGFAG